MSEINDLLNHANAEKPVDFANDFKSMLKDKIDTKLNPPVDEPDKDGDDKDGDDKGGDDKED